MTAAKSRHPLVSLVVAMDEAGVIGVQGGLPWHQPADLRHFKAVTLGHPVVMGRKTWDSIGRPLPGRENLVLTRDQAWKAEGARALPNLEAAIETLAAEGHGEIMVIGGGEIFREALPRADRLHLTRILTRVEGGDTYFPEVPEAEWREVSRRELPADEKNRFPMRFLLLERR